MKAVLETSVRRLRYLVLIIFIRKKASSQMWFDPKNPVKRSAIDGRPAADRVSFRPRTGLNRQWGHLWATPFCCMEGKQWRTQEFCSRGGVQQIQFRTKDRENGDLGDGSPLVRSSAGSCNLVQEISFHIVKCS